MQAVFQRVAHAGNVATLGPANDAASLAHQSVLFATLLIHLLQAPQSVREHPHSPTKLNTPWKRQSAAPRPEQSWWPDSSAAWRRQERTDFPSSSSLPAPGSDPSWQPVFFFAHPFRGFFSAIASPLPQLRYSSALPDTPKRRKSDTNESLCPACRDAVLPQLSTNRLARQYSAPCRICKTKVKTFFFLS